MGSTSHKAPLREDVLFLDHVCLQDVELDSQVPGGLIGLADPGVAVGDGDHGQVS